MLKSFLHFIPQFPSTYPYFLGHFILEGLPLDMLKYPYCLQLNLDAMPCLLSDDLIYRPGDKNIFTYPKSPPMLEQPLSHMNAATDLTSEVLDTGLQPEDYNLRVDGHLSNGRVPGLESLLSDEVTPPSLVDTQSCPPDTPVVSTNISRPTVDAETSLKYMHPRSCSTTPFSTLLGPIHETARILYMHARQLSREYLPHRQLDSLLGPSEPTPLTPAPFRRVSLAVDMYEEEILGAAFDEMVLRMRR